MFVFTHCTLNILGILLENQPYLAIAPNNIKYLSMHKRGPLGMVLFFFINFETSDANVTQFKIKRRFVKP